MWHRQDRHGQAQDRHEEEWTGKLERWHEA
jgi:hypothetical protein